MDVPQYGKNFWMDIWLVSTLFVVANEAEMKTLVLSIFLRMHLKDKFLPGSRIAESEQVYILDFN